ncbi:cell division protein FtsA [uncultured Alistipes sp.]|uniref:cell division protein FtsA n=1 Tax=uncultured Alistipes sp. TaxID=538949 RepID=UPI0025AC169F|nr:cell division protein FtsA [uncultured Alistipes sp.]
METKNYTVAVDLGSSSVVVAVGETRDDGRMHVAAVVSKPVEGVNAGRIDNIELVSRAIREAVSEVEAQLGIRITEAYAGISGDFVRCARHTDHVYVFDPETGVSQRDVDALFDRMRNVQAPDDETIMERIPQNYMVDDSQEVKNPVGSFGKKLSSTFNFILCHKTPIQRLDMALKRLSIKMLGVFSDALATPEAVLLPEEKEEGVAVVDLGAGVTDVTVYYRNVVRYTVSIPMGASAINRDIRTMGVPEKHVESLKRRYGSAVAELAPEDKLIRVNGRTAREAKDILLRNLATVIEARATDIAEFVQQEIKDSGYASKLAYGIVLTGGSAQLKDLDELFRRVTETDVRVAVPDVGIAEESGELAANPAYATAVGILLKGAAQGACAVVEFVAPAASAPRHVRTGGPACGACASGSGPTSSGRFGAPSRFRTARRSACGTTRSPTCSCAPARTAPGGSAAPCAAPARSSGTDGSACRPHSGPAARAPAGTPENRTPPTAGRAAGTRGGTPRGDRFAAQTRLELHIPESIRQGEPKFHGRRRRGNLTPGERSRITQQRIEQRLHNLPFNDL